MTDIRNYLNNATALRRGLTPISLAGSQERHMADLTPTGLETQIPFSIEGKFMLESASKRE
jgi:hypothetical protein